MPSLLDGVSIPVRAALGVVGLSAVFALWLRATHRLRRGDLGDRLTDAFLAAAWLAVVAFYPLASAGRFRPLPAAALVALVAALVLAVSRRRQPSTPPSADPTPAPESAAPAEPTLFTILAVVLAAPFALIASLRLLKGLVAPPMAWDALTYHLPRAAMWVQTGRLALERFPDAWSYYAWYPPGMDVLSAWLMLPVHGDLLLGPFGGLVWVLLLLAARRLARTLGAAPALAWATGLAVASLPCLLAFMTAAYADNAAALLALLAAVHGIEAVRGGRPESVVLAAAAAGLGTAMKTTGVLLALPTCAVLALALRRHRRLRRGGPVAAATAALVLPAAGYLHAWVATGSPFYPNRAPLGLAALLPYHLGLAGLFSGRAFPPEWLRPRGLDAFARLFWADSGGHQLNLGLGGLVLALLAVAALVPAWRRRGSRWAVAYCFAGALLTIPLVFGPETLGLRTYWIGVLGRLLVAGLAPALVCAVLLPPRVAFFGMTAAALGSLVHALPLGWSPAMNRPAAAVLALLVAAGGGAGLVAAWLRRTGRRLLVPVVAAFAFVVAFPAWDRLRREARFPIWADTAGSVAYDVHRLHGAFARQVALWRRFDTPEPKRIAVAVGFDGIGHTQFLYPMLGARLQNRLLWIAMTPDGDNDALDASARWAAADPAAWLGRVGRRRPDYVIGLWPDGPERAWVAAHPELFAMLPDEPGGLGWAARVHPSPAK